MITRRFSPTIAAVMFLVLVYGSLANAEDLRIVSPNHLANEDADGYQAPNCCPSPFSFQQLFPADDFASLPERGALLTGFAWRPDADQLDSPRHITLSNTLFRFSTTDVDVPSARFSENIGDDVTSVRTGTFTISTENTMTPDGTKEFDYVTEFDTHFFYDPSAGNLLWEWSGSLEERSLTDFFSDPDTIVFANWQNASTGSRYGGYVVEFRFASPGDVNGDSAFTVEDIDMLTAAISSGSDDPRFDVNHDGMLNNSDRETWVRDINIKKTWFGDSNLDGEFNSVDFVRVFQAGQYEDGIAMNSGWAEGDWNGDGDFTTADFVVAFADGGYERGQRVSALAAVPEPTSSIGMIAALTILALVRRR